MTVRSHRALAQHGGTNQLAEFVKRLLDEGSAGRMSETRNRAAVSPSPREAGDGWVLDAVLPNGEQTAIAGFSTASDANDWLGSAGHLSWLRDTRTTYCSWSAGEIVERLASCAI